MSRGFWVLIACLAGAPAYADGEVAPLPASRLKEVVEPPVQPVPGGPEHVSAIEGHMVTLPTAFRTRFDAYQAGPDDARVGVLIVPDRWGLSPEVKAWADRVAGLGYRVLAVDLYDGRHASDARMAAEVWRSIDPVWIDADLDGAVAYLRRAQDRIVLMGWGKGVGAGIPLLARHPGVFGAMVTYYDSETVTAGDRAGKQSIPVLDILTPRTLAGPPADALPPQAVADAWTATEQFLARQFP